MTLENAIEIIYERRERLVNLISQIQAHSQNCSDNLEKRIFLQELEITQMWKQDLEEILNELLDEEA